MVRSVGTPVDIAAALQPNEVVAPLRMVPFQLMFVAVARFPSCSVMIADQPRTSAVGVVNVHRSVHPLITGPLLVMSTSAVNPPFQESDTVYAQVTAGSAAAGLVAAASGSSVAAAATQTRHCANPIDFHVMAALYIRPGIVAQNRLRAQAR